MSSVLTLHNYLHANLLATHNPLKSAHAKWHDKMSALASSGVI